MNRIYRYVLSVTNLSAGSSATDGSGALWAILVAYDSGDAGSYAGTTPVRQVINNFKANGLLQSTIGQTFAGTLESLAQRLGQ